MVWKQDTKKLTKLTLKKNDYHSCFLEVADWLEKAADGPEQVFLRKISKDMHEWIKLLDSDF